MIDKLKSKIFILMMIFSSTIIIGIIVLFSVLNCTNTIRTSRMTIERVTRMKNLPEFYTESDSEDFLNRQNKTNEKDLINDNLKKDEINSIQDKINIDSTKGTIDAAIQEFIDEENKKKDSHIKAVIIVALISTGVSILAIYVISKKVSELIVKPVSETLEKQKQFISDASHELKTPLAVIEANSDVLENEVGNNKWLRYIQNEIESMDKLINELLLLAKIENVDDIKSYEKFDLSNKIEMCVSVFESMAYEKKTNLVIDIQKGIVLEGNPQDIEHIVSTLLDNAIKHSESEKEVKIKLKKEKNDIIIRVENYGKEIPEEQREMIFERFYRVSQSRNRAEKRYGLGLSIAKSTVEKYKGKIEIECRDGITSFIVKIPNK